MQRVPHRAARAVDAGTDPGRAPPTAAAAAAASAAGAPAAGRPERRGGARRRPATTSRARGAGARARRRGRSRARRRRSPPPGAVRPVEPGGSRRASSWSRPMRPGSGSSHGRRARARASRTDAGDRDASATADWNSTGRPSPRSTTPRPGVSGAISAAGVGADDRDAVGPLHHAQRHADGAVRRDLLAHDAVGTLRREHEVHAERSAARGDVGDHRRRGRGSARSSPGTRRRRGRGGRARRAASSSRDVAHRRLARARARGGGARPQAQHRALRLALVEVGHDAGDVRAGRGSARTPRRP